LVIVAEIDVNQLAALGKEFPWEKPCACPACDGGLWWHGFVLAYLACFDQPLYFRRLLCPKCGAVHRLRPDSHWPRFQSSIDTIIQVIAYRQRSGHWCSNTLRPRQRQWWRRLRKKALACLGLASAAALFAAFLALLTAGAIPVSSVMQCGGG